MTPSSRPYRSAPRRGPWVNPLVPLLAPHPVRTDGNAQATQDANAHRIGHGGHVARALPSVEARVTVVLRPEGRARERPRRARVHAPPAPAARLVERAAGWREHGIRQDRRPADPRPDLGRDEEAALPDPPQASEVGRQLVREQTAEAILIDAARSAHRQCPGPGVPQPVGNGRRDQVERSVHRIVDTLVRLRHARVVVPYERVDGVIRERDADGDGTRVRRERFASLRDDDVADGRKVGDPEEVGPATKRQRPKVPSCVRWLHCTIIAKHALGATRGARSALTGSRPR